MKFPKINITKEGAMRSIKKIGDMASKNANVIAAGAAIGGVIAVIFTTVKATEKYQKEIEEAEVKKNQEAFRSAENGETGEKCEFEPLTTKEKLLIRAKCYWLVALLAVFTGGCMIASVKFSNKQIQALAVLASATEATLGRTEGAVAELLGESKLEKVKALANEKEVTDNPAPPEDLIEHSDLGGNTLMFDEMSGRYFYGDISAIEAAINRVNAALLRDIGYVSINEFYSELGLHGVSWGEYLGWQFDGLSTRLIDAKLEYASDAHKDPVVILKVKTQPKHDWRDC